jgi:DNA-binding transcriptional regulator YiaG
MTRRDQLLSIPSGLWKSSVSMTATLTSLDQLLIRARERRLPDPTVRRMLRERAGVSQGELALALHVSPAAISRWEAGSRHPRGKRADEYGAALDRLALAGRS